jgi:hypothetical protein
MKLIVTPSHPQLALVLVDLDRRELTRIAATPGQAVPRWRDHTAPAHRPFGITWDDDTLYVTNRHHLLAFDRSLRYVGVASPDLCDNPHQIVWDAGHLYVASPSRGVLRLDGPPFGRAQVVVPLSAAHHCNSLLFHGDRAYVLSHNLGRRPSEVLIYDRRSWTLVDRIETRALSAHNLCVEAGGITTLDTDGRSGLVRNDGTTIALAAERSRFLRGLAVSERFYVAGVSPRTERVYRGLGTSVLMTICRQTNRVVDELSLPDIGAINDLRLIDCADAAHNVAPFWAS